MQQSKTDERARYADEWTLTSPKMGLLLIMRVIAMKTLREFWLKHPNSAVPISCWVDEVRHAEFKTTHAIKVMYPSASFVGKNRVVFNIGGNNFRLVVSVDYLRQAFFVKFVGTHSQYDRIDAATVDIR